MRVKILNKFWNLTYVPNLGNDNGRRVYGLCSPPTEKNKQIKIWMGAKGEEELSTLIHEFFHSANWNITEEFVNDFADDVARILWKMGYRKNIGT